MAQKLTKKQKKQLLQMWGMVIILLVLLLGVIFFWPSDNVWEKSTDAQSTSTSTKEGQYQQADNMQNEQNEELKQLWLFGIDIKN